MVDINSDENGGFLGLESKKDEITLESCLGSVLRT
jgi:hypothetical protein